MKIRTDFVTNSSSSSYIIAFKPSQGNDLSAKLNNLTKTMIDSEGYYVDTDAGHIFYDMASLERWFEEENYYTVDEMFEDNPKWNKEKIQTLLEQGYAVVVKDVSYHDEATRAIIDVLVALNGDNFIILTKENE